METLRLTNPVLSNHPPWLKGEKASKRWITGWCFSSSPPFDRGEFCWPTFAPSLPPPLLIIVSLVSNSHFWKIIRELSENYRIFSNFSSLIYWFYLFFFFHRESGGKKCKGMWENSEGKMVVTCCVLDHMCERIWLKLNWGSEEVTNKIFGKIIFARERCG